MGADPKSIAAISVPPQEEGAMRVCREVSSPPLSDIRELIKGRPDSIEAGLVSVDFDLFIPSVGEIDLVAVSNGRLVMASIFGELTADHLGKAAGIRQWSQENQTVLKRVYLGDSKPDFSVRILFLCSEVDSRALLLMKMIADLPLEIYRYRCLESGQNKWIAIEKVAAEKKALEPVKIPANPRKKAAILPSQFHIGLTDEEIGDFFDMPVEAECQESGDAFEGPYFNS